MKKYFLTTLILTFAAQIYAQSNLVFNEVKIVTLPVSGGVTVPEGKVWKVESINNAGQNYKASIDVDGELFSVPNERVFWLNGGSSVSQGDESLSSGVSKATKLNVIEFNVVAVSSGSGGGGSGSGSGSGSSNGSLPGDDYTPGESITDGDGNTYETVVVNGQTWTTTNLNVSTYRDGTPIPYISDYDEWNNATTGAYTYAGQDSNAGYGKLYNLYAVLGDHDGDSSTSNKILAPEGYHIPTSNEWSTLIEFYMDDGIEFNFDEIFEAYVNIPFQHSIASIYLKSQTSWDINGNNESGLNIKNYPFIRDYDSFYDVYNGYPRTAFATQTWCQFSIGSVLGVYGISIGDTGLGVIPLSDYQGGSYPEDNRGHYVRLIKD